MNIDKQIEIYESSIKKNNELIAQLSQDKEKLAESLNELRRQNSDTHKKIGELSIKRRKLYLTNNKVLIDEEFFNWLEYHFVKDACVKIVNKLVEKVIK